MLADLIPVVILSPLRTLGIILRGTTGIVSGPNAQSQVFEAVRFRDTQRRESRPHTHDRGQLTCVVAGVMHQETDTGVWIVPRQRLIWIPPATVHAGRSKGAVEGWLVLVPARHTVQLPARPCVLQTSRLLLAALERLTEVADANGPAAAILSQVILLELGEAEAQGLEIPMPRTPRLRAIAEQLIADPAGRDGLDTWARAAALSRRSFTRHFEHETGLSFGQWRRRVIAECAIERLSYGESVSSVALAMGYESVSAFVAMFKRLHGAPPAEFVAQSDHR